MVLMPSKVPEQIIVDEKKTKEVKISKYKKRNISSLLLYTGFN